MHIPIVLSSFIGFSIAALVALIYYRQWRAIKYIDAYLRADQNRICNQEKFRISQEYINNSHYIYGWVRPHESIALPDYKDDHTTSIAYEILSYLKEYKISHGSFYELVRVVNLRQYKKMARLVLSAQDRHCLSDDDDVSVDLDNLPLNEVRPLLTALFFIRKESMPAYLMVDPDDVASENYDKTVRVIRCLALALRSVSVDKDIFYNTHVNEVDVNLNPMLTDSVIRAFFENVLGTYWTMVRGNEVIFPTTLFNDAAMRNNWLPCPVDNIGNGQHQIEMVKAVMTAYSIITEQSIPMCFYHPGKLTIQVINILRSSTQWLRVI